MITVRLHDSVARATLAAGAAAVAGLFFPAALAAALMALAVGVAVVPPTNLAVGSDGDPVGAGRGCRWADRRAE